MLKPNFPLDRKVIIENKGFRLVRYWFKGIHASGRVVKGYTGWETVFEKEVIIAKYRFTVAE